MLKGNLKAVLGIVIVLVTAVTIFTFVIPDLIGDPYNNVFKWIPAFAGMTEKEAKNNSSDIVSDQTTVLMIEKGFEPEKITIKVGTKITFINKDKVSRWPASDLHPTHTIYPQFDPKGPITPGASWEFTFERSGEWNFHDHLSPLLTGKVIVVE